jgi:hypothetical protein
MNQIGLRDYCKEREREREREMGWLVLLVSSFYLFIAKLNRLLESSSSLFFSSD